MEASVGLCWDRAVVGGGLDRVITQIFANPEFQSPQVLVPLGELEALRTSRSRTPCIVSVADILQISCLPYAQEAKWSSGKYLYTFKLHKSNRFQLQNNAN